MSPNNTANIGAVSVAAAAQLIGVSHSTAKALCRTGELRSFQVGRRRLVAHAAIIDFIAMQEGRQK